MQSDQETRSRVSLTPTRSLRSLRWLGWAALASCVATGVACGSSPSTGPSTDDGGDNDASPLDASDASSDALGDAAADADAPQSDAPVDATVDADATTDAPEEAMSDGQGGGADAKDAATDASEAGIVGPSPFVLFGMSSSNATAMRKDGTVVGWGFGGLGAVGNGTFVSASSPVTVNGLTNPVFFGTSGSARHQCVVMPDTTVECWGANESGQLGNGTTVNSSTPVVVLMPPLAPSAPPPSDAGADSAGGSDAGPTCTHSACSPGANLSSTCGSCAAAVCDHDNYCCTTSWDGTCVAEAEVLCPSSCNASTGGTCSHTTCTVGKALAKACDPCATTVCGLESSCCNQLFGSWTSSCVFVAANNCADPCGSSAMPDASAEADAGVVVGGPLTGAVAVSMGSDFTCALLSNGTVTCWGGNEHGQLGNGTEQQLAELTSRTPLGTTVPGVSNVKAIAAGDANVCALIADGTVQCWGFGAEGALGLGPSNNKCGADQVTPQPVVGLSDAIAVCNANFHACAVHATGTVTCWGWGPLGQTGDGQFNQGDCSPVDITTFGGAVDVACSSDGSCALTSDGHVWCWGGNQNGEIANGITPSPQDAGFFLGPDSGVIYPPTQIGRISNATAIRMGGSTVCALTQSVDDAGVPDASVSALQCWGNNADGEVGVGSTNTAITEPETVP